MIIIIIMIKEKAEGVKESGKKGKQVLTALRLFRNWKKKGFFEIVEKERKS